MIPNAVIDNPNLSIRDKLVLIKVASHAYGSSNVASPSQKSTAESLGCRRETVADAYESLVALKVLEPHGNGSNGRKETFSIDLDRAANLTTCSTGIVSRKPSGTLTSRSAPNLATQSAAPGYSVGTNKSRAKQQTKPNQDGFAALTGSSPSDAEVNTQPEDSIGNVEALPRLPATPGARALTRAEINGGLYKPDGRSVKSDFEGLDYGDQLDKLDDLLTSTLAEVYGTVVSRAKLEAIAAEYTIERCAFWAYWLPRKIANYYENKRQPPPKPTGIYLDALAKKYPANPKWPAFDAKRHTWAARSQADMRAQAAHGAVTRLDEAEEAFGGASPAAVAVPDDAYFQF